MILPGADLQGLMCQIPSIYLFPTTFLSLPFVGWDGWRVWVQMDQGFAPLSFSVWSSLLQQVVSSAVFRSFSEIVVLDVVASKVCMCEEVSQWTLFPPSSPCHWIWIYFYYLILGFYLVCFLYSLFLYTFGLFFILILLSPIRIYILYSNIFIITLLLDNIKT